MKELLRKIPKVDDLLRTPALAESLAQYGDRAVTDAIRAELDILRQGILSGQISTLPETSVLCQRIGRCVQHASLPSFRKVINGTGILLHTNLGRACLPEKAARAVYEASRAYSTWNSIWIPANGAAATAMWRASSAASPARRAHWW